MNAGVAALQPGAEHGARMQGADEQLARGSTVLAVPLPGVAELQPPTAHIAGSPQHPSHGANAPHVPLSPAGPLRHTMTAIPDSPGAGAASRAALMRAVSEPPHAISAVLTAATSAASTGTGIKQQVLRLPPQPLQPGRLASPHRNVFVLPDAQAATDTLP